MLFRSRRRIYKHIVKSPGLHERQLAKELDIPLSTLIYHLHYLEKRELIGAKSGERYTRYYASKKIGARAKEILSILRQKMPRKIVMYLLLHPNSFHREIADRIDVAPSTTSFHLKKLLERDIAKKVKVGKETMYMINEPEQVSDLLITYKESFLDSAVDRFVDAWSEFNPENVLRKTKKEEEKEDEDDEKPPVLSLLITGLQHLWLLFSVGPPEHSQSSKKHNENTDK